jgi:hypothetical protein
MTAPDCVIPAHADVPMVCSKCVDRALVGVRETALLEAAAWFDETFATFPPPSGFEATVAERLSGKVVSEFLRKMAKETPA